MVSHTKRRRTTTLIIGFPWQFGASLRQPLLHELIWSAFCLLMAMRLLLVGQAALALSIYVALLLPYALLVLRGCMLADQPRAKLWQRIRLLYPFLIMNLLYQATAIVVPALGVKTSWDHELAAIDRRILQFDLYHWLDTQAAWIYRPGISDIFSLSYMLLFVLLIAEMVRVFHGPLQQQAACAIGLWTVYAVGFLGYTLFPAQGPYVAFADQYQTPITGGFFTSLNAWLVDTGAPGFDVFPSLHIAASAFLLFWYRRVAPRAYRLLVVPVGVLWLSTIYLRYHYVIDLLVGGLLAWVALWLAMRALDTTDQRP
jgi:membrane-associated phospholipid phosphatase